MKRIIYLIILTAGIYSCAKTNEYLPTDFNYSIPQVDITENVNVGAYYYNNATSDWAKKYTNTPVLGEYSALNPATMGQHRVWADTAGLDYFIFPWNGTTDDSLLNNFMDSRTEQVKMVVDYNTAHLKATNSSPLTGSKLTVMLDELKMLSNNYFVKDGYFKIDSRPVILIKPINLSASAASSIDYGSVISAVRNAFTSMGINPYLIGEITSGWLPPQRYSQVNKLFDAVVLSDWRTTGNYGYDRSVFFQSYADQAFKHWTDSTTVWGIDFVPCIMPGFDDKVMTSTSKVYNIDRSVQLYTDMCNVAKRNMGSNRIVVIDSWNNFQLGTSIEPTSEYGSDYLTTTKEQFKVK